ncbi:aminoglycoside 3'-phosphotransferase-1 [Sphingomonas guangdongensis]|uniref:Aminoglycoside 3'-phosphotransferase n=1 Tax=Sphingomonas guangdongensis TaxID=1141890 RepID=A0A285QF39_9SPHN|nr:APH(3')-I family aminoglycoside O-phosphotransferase [Sphingomonas guangdongensis]SOB80104.1 aminoglycoside 3'-phosphotransferase-1 [Sphingomonas guangdongensis]
MSATREEASAPARLPGGWADALGGYAWARDRVGESGAAVYRLHGRAGAPELYLKHGAGPTADDVVDEAVRLRWLAAHLPAPAVVRFATSADEAWLLTTALPGRTAYQLLETGGGEAAAVVDALADLLVRLHAVPVHACTFISDHARRLLLARARINAGLVDEDDFDEEREGWSAEQVWDALDELLPLVPDLVVTHGDYSLDNILLQDEAVTGCIDVGRLGIADRYQDLAVMWNCLGEFGSDLQQRFLARYGIDRLNERKLRFHLLLDELF